MCIRDRAGGRLFIYTDGVTEGRTLGGQMLGLPGLQALLDQHAALAPAEQLARVAAALVRPGMRLHDDLTMLVIG